MTQFIAPKKSLGNLDVDAAARVIAASADVALVLDQQGVIRDVAVSNPELGQEGYADWLGQAWTEIVTPESRPKIEALLRDADGGKGSTWRHVNHPSPRGADVPMLYSAIRVGKTGKVVAVGRNLRQVAQLQQRLVEAQQSLERDYARLRHAETRYRMLFQLASEAILIIDAGNEKVIELNPAAQSLLGASAKQLAGKPFADVFDALCSRRPYKEPVPLETALAALRAESGKHFDPHLVQVFDQQAATVYSTLTEADEEQLQALLTRMVRKHFSL